jgi:protoporphyrinogen oxidase
MIYVTPIFIEETFQMTNNSAGVIIGAGPAGLSAAETLSKSNHRFIVLEANHRIGGISATIKYNDFYFDLGVHRFFTKNKEIDRYVIDLLGSDRVMVDRSSVILLNGKIFTYPLKPVNAIFGLGPVTAAAIISNYVMERLKYNRRPPRSLEDWVIRQFGKTLYRLFFKTYTEKVWGIDCDRISAEWAVQRIKGLSLRTAIIDAFWGKREKDASSLVKHFYYPRKGIGMICDKLAETVKAPNQLLINSPVTELFHDGEKITAVAYSGKQGKDKIASDFVISSMPITELITSLKPAPPGEIIKAAQWLKYRSIIFVALMFDFPSITEHTWVYIHDPQIKLARFHEPKNCSIEMAPRDKACLVFEHFCNEGDAVWNASDEELYEKTKWDFKKTNITPEASNKITDYKVVRVPKAYPLYEVGFSRYLLKIRDYLKGFKNLQLVGRYGTYKYNNLDHSLETGIKGAQNILGADHDTFMVNIESEYHEEIE